MGNVDIDGQAVTVGANGVTAASTSSPTLPSLVAPNTVLSDLGMTMTLNNPTDAVQGPSASRTLDGLKITIDITTLDTAADKIGALLPSSFTSQLPLPLPDSQQLTLDLGTVSVASDASPAFVESVEPVTASPVSGNSGNSGTAGSSTAGNSGSSGNTGNSGNSGSGGTGGTSGGASGSPTGSTAAIQPTSSTSPVFSGIGAALILLGLAGAAAMAYGYRRIEDLTELEGMDCVYANPQTDFSGPGGGPLPDPGGTPL
jgi:hypothetical protein